MAVKLILDTNVFVADFWMTRTPFVILKDGLRRSEIQLVVPTVVIDEVETKYRERVNEAFSNAEKAAQAIRELRGPNAPTSEPLRVGNEADQYARFLRDELTRIGATVAPIPSVPHAQVLRRATMKRRPFDQRGGGYRDALIWESVLEATRERERVCFISMDADFAENNELHGDLVADLDNSARQNFQFFRSLAAFNENWIVPTLRSLDSMLVRLNGGGNLLRHIQRDVAKKMLDYDEGFGEVGFGFPYESVSVYVDPAKVVPQAIVFSEARQLDSGDLVVHGRFTFMAGVGVSIWGKKLHRLPAELVQEYGLRRDEDCSVDLPPEKFNVGFVARLSGASFDELDIVSVEVTSIGGPRGELVFG